MLTAREIEVLEHLSKGEPNEKIALELNITPRTVKSYINTIYLKARIPSRANKRVWAAVHAAEIMEQGREE